MVGESSLNGRRILPQWSRNPPSLVVRSLPHWSSSQRSSSLKGRTNPPPEVGHSWCCVGRANDCGPENPPSEVGSRGLDAPWNPPPRVVAEAQFLPRRSGVRDGGGVPNEEESSLKGRIVGWAPLRGAPGRKLPSPPSEVGQCVRWGGPPSEVGLCSVGRDQHASADLKTSAASASGGRPSPGIRGVPDSSGDAGPRIPS